MTTLWLARHAQVQIAAGVCYGALDVAADPAATWAAARALADAVPVGLMVRVSPLQRCKQLAHDIQGLRPDLIIEIDARLSELNFGRFEGQRWDSLPQHCFDAWMADFWGHRFGGAESVAELMARVGSAWRQAQRVNQDQVWITHAGVIRAASLLARGVRRVAVASQWPAQAPAYGQWLKLAKKADVQRVFSGWLGQQASGVEVEQVHQQPGQMLQAARVELAAIGQPRGQVQHAGQA